MLRRKRNVDQVVLFLQEAVDRGFVKKDIFYEPSQDESRMVAVRYYSLTRTGFQLITKKY